MTRETFEAALDEGRLFTKIIWLRGEPKWYLCRRNGKTRTWKSDPARFEIPIKFRLRDFMVIRAENFNRGEVDEWFREEKSDDDLR